MKTCFLKELTALGMPSRLFRLVTALAMAEFSLGVCQWHAWSHGVEKTYGPGVKTALDAEAQSVAGILPLDLVRHLSLAWGGHGYHTICFL